MRKTLIINADDFGLTRGVNSAIAECARLGTVRSATIMANAPAFDDAVRTAGETPNLGVGIHFVLTGLEPLSGDVPDLAPNGLLPSSPVELLKIALTRRLARRQIEKELLAQTEKVFDSGIVPTHFDSHKHVHIIPPVHEIMMDIARRFSVKWIRNPFESMGAVRFVRDVQAGRRIVFLKQYVAGSVTNPVSCCFQARIARSGLRTPDFFHGVAATGLMNGDILRHLCRFLRPGINELMTHPGYLDADLENQKTRLLLSREQERNLYASAGARELFIAHGIDISHFGEVNL